MSKALLITGATGKQGSALINALLRANANLELVALTRNAQSVSAQKLQAKSKSIKLITGDLNNIDDVFKKAKKATEKSIWGVFSVQVGNPTRTSQAYAKALRSQSATELPRKLKRSRAKPL